MIIKLDKPFKYEDLEVSEIDLDFDKASTRVLEQADREMARRKLIPTVKQLDTTYCLVVASYLTGIPYAALADLPLKIGNEVATTVSGFLLGMTETELETPTEI